MALTVWTKAMGVGVVLASLAFAMSETVSAAPAASRDAVGQVSCTFSSGLIKLNPPRHPPTGGPEEVRATLKATTGSANPCTGPVTLGGKPVTISAAKIRMEVIVAYTEGDPDRPLVVGTVYSGEILWRIALPKSKVAPTLFTFTGGTWHAPNATVPPSGGNLVNVTGSFGGNGASVSLSLDAPGLFAATAPSKHSTTAILGGSIAEVSGSTVPPTTTTTCSAFGC